MIKTGKLVLAAAATLYAVLTFFQINRWSIWFDEAFSAYLVRFNFAEIAHYTGMDVHPPLYYWVLKCWTSLLGTSDIAFRSLSLFFGIVVIILAYKLVQKLFDTRAAMWTATLLAISPMLIRYGQEARMYTMVAAIVLGATYMLVKATETNRRRHWVIYAILLAAGMWTHYFAALAWLAHWAWRAVLVRKSAPRKKRLKMFFSKEWTWVHIGAIALFLPWLPSMVFQLTVIQAYGFWIAPITADSVTNFLTSMLLFRQHDMASGWFALLFYVIVGILAVLLYRTHKAIGKDKRQWFWLIVASIVTPIVLLILVSLPPAQSSYMERYMIPAFVFASILLALCVRYGLEGLSKKAQVLVPLLIVVTLGLGVQYAQTIGNFNKSTNRAIDTKQLATGVAERSSVYEPIIVLSAWTYFELSFYETSQHPVYYTASGSKGEYGSLLMLQDPNPHKIADVEAFARGKKTVWVANETSENIEPPVKSWKKLQSFDVYDNRQGIKRYQAVQYEVR